jgi:8-oxo-dGTP diphosphatase
MRREYPEAPVAAVGVVVLKDDEVLLIRRGKEPRRGGWSLPGGAVELGETVRQAAEREIKEECNVDIRATEVIEVLDAISQDGEGRARFHYVLTELLAEYLGGTPSAHSDALEARWFDLKELDVLDMLPISVRIIREGAELGQRMAAGQISTRGRAWQTEFWS